MPRAKKEQPEPRVAKKRGATKSTKKEEEESTDGPRTRKPLKSSAVAKKKTSADRVKKARTAARTVRTKRTAAARKN